MKDDWFLKWMFRILFIIMIFVFWLASQTYANASESWDDWIREDLIGQEILWHDTDITIVAPYRATDPAGVEISIDASHEGKPSYHKLTLVIDENPTPCCATFEFYDEHPHVMTNVRVNAYTDLTVLSEDEYKNYSYNQKFIKAAGGCSAPPTITTDKPFGTINLIQIPGWTKIKIWHPNYSGLQFDQLTRSEIPALFIENVKMWVNDKLVWEYNGTIGIAQDVFFMMPIHTVGKAVRVQAIDNEGQIFNYTNYMEFR